MLEIKEVHIQRAKDEIEGQLSSETEIRHAVRVECIFSPLLFHV